MKRSTPPLTIAIPAYNEKDAIRHIVTKALAVGRTYTPNIEVLVVDDGSTDGTSDIVDTLAKRHGQIKVIHHPKNLGFSGAIKTCYRKATNDTIFLLPADGQVDVTDLKRFWEALPHADVVVGYRIHNPEPLGRKLNSFIFHSIYRILFGAKLKEISTSILWRKRVLDTITITATPRSALIEPEVIYKAWIKGYRSAQVGIPYYPRHSGKAKGANPLMILITLKELIRLWWTTRIQKFGVVQTKVEHTAQKNT